VQHINGLIFEFQHTFGIRKLRFVLDEVDVMSQTGSERFLGITGKLQSLLGSFLDNFLLSVSNFLIIVLSGTDFTIPKLDTRRSTFLNHREDISLYTDYHVS
jgi:hypothetical protein